MLIGKKLYVALFVDRVTAFGSHGSTELVEPSGQSSSARPTGFAIFVHVLGAVERAGLYELNEGDPRFWYARGNVVSEFLDKLWQVAWAPIEQEATKQIDFRGRTERQKQLYLFVPSHAKLNFS